MCKWHQSFWCLRSSPDSCLRATKGARFKMFPFQAAVSTAALCKVTQPALGHISLLPFQKPCGRALQLHPLPFLHIFTHIKVHHRQQDRAVQIIQCYTVFLYQKSFVEGGCALPVPPEMLYRQLGNKESAKIARSEKSLVSDVLLSSNSI